jgi:hypothetical protein
MDVAKKCEQIVVGVNKHCVIAPLKEVTGRLEMVLDSASVDTSRPQDDFPERHIRNLDHHMDVVGHPAVRVEPGVAAQEGVSDNPFEQVAIGLAKEYWIAMIAAQGDVIETSWDVQSWPSRHRAGSRQSGHCHVTDLEAFARPSNLRALRANR